MVESGNRTRDLHAKLLRVEPKTVLSVNERALAYGMLHNFDDAISQYTCNDDGTRTLDKTLDAAEWPALVAEFKKDPKTVIARARLNIFSIHADTSFSEANRIARIDRYVQALERLQILLDHTAFPNTDELQTGVPAYIPDGLVDLGSNSQMNPRYRGREMVKVDKAALFAQSHGVLMDFYTKDEQESSGDDAKKRAVVGFATAVYRAMPYNVAGHDYGGDVVGLHEVFDKKFALCRHHALYTQVLLQSAGITSRLFKCDLDMGDGTWGTHVANLVRINNAWYILDTTNPDEENGKGEVFFFPINVTKQSATELPEGEWSVQRKRDGKTWRYRSRDDMYYTIQHS